MNQLPKAPLARIMKKAGAVRVSPAALDEFGSALEEVGAEISKKAVELAQFAKRTTVRREDVKLATQ